VVLTFCRNCIGKLFHTPLLSVTELIITYSCGHLYNIGPSSSTWPNKTKRIHTIGLLVENYTKSNACNTAMLLFFVTLGQLKPEDKYLIVNIMAIMKQFELSERNIFAQHAQNTFSFISLQKCWKVENILLLFIIILCTIYWGTWVRRPFILKCVGDRPLKSPKYWETFVAPSLYLKVWVLVTISRHPCLIGWLLKSWINSL